MRGLEPELAQLGTTHNDLIRAWVVPADRRDEFDRLAAGLPAVDGESRPR